MGEQLREIVASELERIGDERLELVTITAVDVDGSLETADVFYSAMSADEEGRSEEVAEALDEQRWKVQQLINRAVQMRRTPQIRFRPDTVLSSALRIEEILRDIGQQDDGEPDHREQGDGEQSGADAAPTSSDEPPE